MREEASGGREGMEGRLRMCDVGVRVRKGGVWWGSVGVKKM